MPLHVPRSLDTLYVNEDLFWSHVEKTEGCWLWTASTGNGYGQFWVGRKRDGTRALFRSHRIAYELLVGPIPEELTLDHACRTKTCVNPAHLEPVTHGQNVLRGTHRAAENAQKTHCQYGHPLFGENLYTYGKARQCRECRRRRVREYDRRHRRATL